MDLLKKITAGAAVLLGCANLFAFNTSQFTQSIEKYNETAAVIDDGLYDFSKQLSIAVPQAATQQNVWADAYIGKLFPSIIPHIGAGFNMGLTHFDTSGLADVAKVLDINNVKSSYLFPVFTADLRVGGLFLPFDFGITAMKTNTISTSFTGCDLDFDFMTLGFDMRYALIEGGIILPKVSVGAGYFYNQGSFGAGNSSAEVSVDYKVQTMYLQAQVSKSLIFITPFAGVRGLVSKSDNSYDWTLKGSAYEAVLPYTQTIGAKTSGSGSYKSSGFDFGAFQPQVFAGVGMNFFLLQTTLSVTADLRNIGDNGLWSGAFSFRLKL